MTPELIRFIVNTRETFARLTDQQLYQLTVSLAAELHERHVNAEPEARALCAALLAFAQVEQRAIYSEDCADDPWWCGDCRGVHAPLAHRHAPPAEKS
jgi:hypothetical protein